MTHPRDDSLQQWLDGEFDDLAAGEELAAHVASCPRCAARVEAVRVLHRATLAWAEEVPVDTTDLVERVLRSGEAPPATPEAPASAQAPERSRGAPVIPLRRWVWAAVAVAAALVLTVSQRGLRETRITPPAGGDDGGGPTAPLAMGADVVRVDVVGAKSYAVLTVPGMTEGATTTVVWIQDEPDDNPPEHAPETVQ